MNFRPPGFKRIENILKKKTGLFANDDLVNQNFVFDEISIFRNFGFSDSGYEQLNKNVVIIEKIDRLNLNVRWFEKKIRVSANVIAKFGKKKTMIFIIIFGVKINVFFDD